MAPTGTSRPFLRPAVRPDPLHSEIALLTDASEGLHLPRPWQRLPMLPLNADEIAQCQDAVLEFIVSETGLAYTSLTLR